MALSSRFYSGVSNMSLYEWLVSYIFNGVDVSHYEDYIVITLVILTCLLVGLLIKAFTGVLNIFIR